MPGRRPRIGEIKRLLKAAMKKQNDFIVSCKTCDQKCNPQVIAMRQKTEGQLDALEAAYSALNNDTLYLRILAAE
jgi:hypothetical protein